MSSKVINFFRNLNIITSYGKDVILIDKFYPRIYRIPKKIFFYLKKTSEISPDLIKDYNNLRAWSFLPNKKRQEYYSSLPIILSLIVSEDCNLNCSYCFNKENMLNAKGIKYMSKETAIRALNFFLSYFKKRNVWVLFFGGEPFLNFPVIKETVDHIKKIKNKEFKLRIVTNGTIMNKSIAQWISDNNIEIAVSLNLPPSEQNRTRPFKNGRPSFEIVKNNLLMLAKNIPHKNLRIKTVVAKDSNVKIQEIYRSFYKHSIPIDTINIDYEMHKSLYTDRCMKIFYRNFNSQKRAIRKSQLQRLVTSTSNDFTHLKLYKKEILSTPLDIIIIGRGGILPCTAAVHSSMTINAIGDIYFCCIVANQKEFYLGNIKDGIDKIKFKSIKEKYLLKPKECVACWASCFCNSFCPGIRWIEKRRKEECKRRKKEFIETLRFFLSLDYNQIQRIFQYILYASNDKNYIRSQKYNFKIALQIYKFINETNKYIKPVNVPPY